MPFKSKAQRRWMYANNPDMAKEWDSYGKSKYLPERVKPLKARRRLVKKRSKSIPSNTGR
jgi:hypothetical protein